jgi:peptidoglycan hydrolase-like protein with peptidoglycan-binding domain
MKLSIRITAAAALAVVLAAPAAAQSVEDVAAAQEALAWTGHYDGPIDGRPRSALRTSVTRFQRESGFRPTGHLSAQELDYLLEEGDSVRAAVGYEPFTDPQTGITIGIPRALTPRMEQSERGTRFAAEDDRVSIELVRFPETDLAGFRRVIMAGHPDLRVTYSAGGRGWYVVTGFIDERQFYSRARLDPPGLVAFAVTYDSALEHRVEPAIVAMSSAFVRPHILSMATPRR